MQPIISVNNLSKSYASGFQALKNINLGTVSYTHLTLPTTPYV